MSKYESNKQQGMGCLTLAFIFFSICWGIAIIVTVMHPPINFVSILAYTIIFALYLFLYSPLGRPLLWKSSLLAKIPLLIFILFCVYLLLQQYALSSPQAIFSLFTLCIYFFTLSPWFKYTLRWFPTVLIMLIVISGILVTYPLVIHQPLDYVKLFLTLSVSFSLLAILLFFQRGKVDEAKTMHFDVGQTHVPQEENSTSEKPTIEIHFLGLSFRVFRYGKFTKITLSTD
jgi:hypothetical protein